MAWAATLLVYTEELQAYDEGRHEQEPKEPLPTQTNKQNLNPPYLPKQKLDNLPPYKEKDKMPPMER
jgi:hypothetical protein